MKTSPFTKAALSSLIILSFSAAQADELGNAVVTDQFTGNVSGYLGHKSMDENDWSSLDSQYGIGVLLDVKKQSWPVSIVFGLVGTGDVHKNGASKTEGYTRENRIGVRKTFDAGAFHPHFGGGVTVINAEIKNKQAGIVTSKDDDSATGAWVGAGLNYDVNDHFILGFDVTYTEAEVTLFGDNREAGGIHSGITAGYHW